MPLSSIQLHSTLRNKGEVEHDCEKVILHTYMTWEGLRETDPTRKSRSVLFYR